MKWTHSGLYLLEVRDGMLGQSPGIELDGHLLHASASQGSSTRHDSHNDRAVLRGKQVYYVRHDGIWSALWGAPDEAVNFVLE